MHQAGYHQVNALAQRISKDIKSQLHERDNHMLAMLQAIPSLAKSSSDSDDTLDKEELDHHLSQIEANMTSTSDRIQLEMLHLLKELSNNIKASHAVPNQDHSR